MEDTVSPPGSFSRNQALPPIASDAPNTVTSCPRAAATQAASIPAIPAPITATRLGLMARAGEKSTSSGRLTRGLFTQAIGTCIMMIAPQHVLQDRQYRISQVRPAAALRGQAGSATSGRPRAIS